jgi:NAD(P)-dependent dehydrogenase (short-subunit alcohol dehydrogenase family)
MSRLDGKVAIIPGAGRGIGRATARLFAAEGAKVAVLSLNARGTSLCGTSRMITAVANAQNRRCQAIARYLLTGAGPTTSGIFLLAPVQQRLNPIAKRPCSRVFADRRAYCDEQRPSEILRLSKSHRLASLTFGKSDVRACHEPC